MKTDLAFNWTKTNQEFESNVEAHDNVLSFENLNSENEGQYKCKIENINKTKTESIILHLDVKSKF